MEAVEAATVSPPTAPTTTAPSLATTSTPQPFIAQQQQPTLDPHTPPLVAPPSDDLDGLDEDFIQGMQKLLAELRDSGVGEGEGEGDVGSAAADGLPDMANLMGELEKGLDDPQMEGFLEKFLHQLIAKDILYAPMLEMKNKVPHSTITHLVCNAHSQTTLTVAIVSLVVRRKQGDAECRGT